MVARGLSEPWALAVVARGAAAFRHVPRPDANGEPRERILALMQRHTRYGAGLIYLKLRQSGLHVNQPRVDRVYSEAHLSVKRRQRKKVPVMDRQPMTIPTQANEVWAANFVFERTAEWRLLTCLTIVDNATREAVAIMAARAVGGLPVTRVLEQLAARHGLPQVLRNENGPELCGHAMLTWAHSHGLTLRLIRPGQPNPNAYIESYNGRFRDECLNEHWFTSVVHAQAV